MNNNVSFNNNISLVSSGTTYNIGSELSTNKAKLTNVSYNSGTNTTTFSGILTFPAGSISNSALAILTSANTFTDSQTYNKIMYLKSDLSIAGDLVACWIYNYFK